MSKKKELEGVGVVVGRFQTPHLHEGHYDLIHQVIERHKKRLYVLGTPMTGLTYRDPLDFQTRKLMIQAADPDSLILPIQDNPSDVRWSQELDKLVTANFPKMDVTLYGGRDCFFPHYRGSYKKVLLAGVASRSATQLRDELMTSGPAGDMSFRKGMIYAAGCAFPRTFPTVDIAVTDGSKVLLGQKGVGDDLQFPGGFVDPNDISLEAAAKRELREEVPGISIEGSLSYVGSFLVNDWRYGPMSRDRIMTTLFHGEYTFGHLKAGDDLHAVAWYPLNKATARKVHPVHKELYAALADYLREKLPTSSYETP